MQGTLAGTSVEEHYLQQSASTALWEMFPNHPNLLPAYFAEDDIRKWKNMWLNRSSPVKAQTFDH